MIKNMQLVILAGGLGSRLSEETSIRPKPLVEIGGMPILWHIMKIYASFGVNNFIICVGYKGYMIKEYFANLRLHSSNLTISADGSVKYHEKPENDWTITIVDTGTDTQTGGRLLRVKDYIDGETFFMTYGDGLADVDINKSYKFHDENACLATVTATHPTARFGALELDGHIVNAFVEKPVAEGGWINGGFFVLDKGVFDYIQDDGTLWEQEPMRQLAVSRQLMAFQHDGFWQPMDTLREKQMLEDLWVSGTAPWKVWD